MVPVCDVTQTGSVLCMYSYASSPLCADRTYRKVLLQIDKEPVGYCSVLNFTLSFIFLENVVVLVHLFAVRV